MLGITKEAQESMAKKDRRHNLNSGIAKPATEDELNVVRCQGCRRLITEHEIRHYGRCPRCNGTRVHGAGPNPLEMVWLQIKYIFHHGSMRGYKK